MRYMQQVSSLHTKTRGPAWINECSQTSKMRYMQQVRSLRTKKGVTIGSMGAPGKPKRYTPSPQPAHENKGSPVGLCQNRVLKWGGEDVY